MSDGGKPSLAIMIGTPGKGKGKRPMEESEEEEPMEGEGEEDDGAELEGYAQDLIDALGEKDAAGVAAAFRSMSECC